MKAIDEELENWVPTLIKPNAKVGKLKSDVARKLFVLCGFEKNDVNVSCGGGDNAMSALGVGATRDGLMVASLGTSGTLFGYSSKSVFDPSGVICPFCDATGAYLPLMCTLNCTEVPENVRNTITSPPLTHEEITSLASQEPAGCNGLQVLPYFRGERTPNWPHASGALVGIRHDTMGKPGLVYRAALEGVTYSLLSGVNQMKTFTGVSRLKQLIVVGGGSHNDLWCQIIADSFGVPVSLPREVETAALGGALQAAAVHSGEDIASFVATHCPGMKRTIEPKLDTSTAALYQSAFERHEDFGKKLFG
jgi:xylulokinase